MKHILKNLLKVLVDTFILVPVDIVLEEAEADDGFDPLAISLAP